MAGAGFTWVRDGVDQAQAEACLAAAAQPGQFVLVMLDGAGERIPLTIADVDRAAGTFTLVIQAVGKTTRQMQAQCHPGTSLFAVMGPLGQPTQTNDAESIVCVGGGLGVAPVFPHLRESHARGAHVIGIIGFRTRDLVFWEDRFRAHCDELVVCTDDGSVGFHGLVSQALEQTLATHPRVDHVVAIGPPRMMQACADVTRPFAVPTTVSLNPIMVDGTGMCGGCRVRVGDDTRFACVDGPDFDGHLVDFDELLLRLGRFRTEERDALERWERHRCRMPERDAWAGEVEVNAQAAPAEGLRP